LPGQVSFLLDNEAAGHEPEAFRSRMEKLKIPEVFRNLGKFAEIRQDICDSE
jgi:hypothetical protein